MLYFNLVKVMNIRGIINKSAFLIDKGFARQTAFKMAKNDVWEIRLSNLEKLCLALNCTPNDLFRWVPDENQIVGENTALKSLIREKEVVEITQIVKDLPIEKLERVKEMLAQLKDED